MSAVRPDVPYTEARTGNVTTLTSTLESQCRECTGKKKQACPVQHKDASPTSLQAKGPVDPRTQQRDPAPSAAAVKTTGQ